MSNRSPLDVDLVMQCFFLMLYVLVFVGGIALMVAIAHASHP